MARGRHSNTSTTSPTQTEAPVEVENTPTEVNPEENVAMTTVTEQAEVKPDEAPLSTTPDAPVASESDAPAEDAPKVEKVIDLTAFDEAVQSAQTNKDPETGMLEDEHIERVVEAFNALDGVKAKNKAKASLNDSMKDAMNAMDIQTARCYMKLLDAVSTAKPKGAERTPTDPTEAFVERIVGLQLASALVKANVPEDVAAEWQAKANELYTASTAQAETYRTWLQRPAVAEGEEDTKEPEVSGLVKFAVKLSLGKAVKGGGAKSGGGAAKSTSAPYEGTRRDIAKHISNAFADKEVGTFLSVNEIRMTKSPEYGDDLPSSGAISVRLFPTKPGAKMSLTDVAPAHSKDGKNHKGAVKL